MVLSGATKYVANCADPRVGVLLRPGNGNKPPPGKKWAIDNGAFIRFKPEEFLKLLRRLAHQASDCLWVAAPDVVGDAAATRRLFDEWEPQIAALGFPLAFVLQDGQRAADVPWGRIRCVFVGGFTRFKLGPEAKALTDEARRRGLLVHVGRVNTKNRIEHCFRVDADSFDGSSFTCFADVKVPLALNWMNGFEYAARSQATLFGGSHV